MKLRAALLAAVAGIAFSAATPATAETLVIAAADVPEGFDGDALRPGTQAVVPQIYENLTKYGRKTDDNGREVLDPSVIEGSLAESWTVSEDGLRYVFKLREGVESPYGNELTADDVVWSWEKSRAQKRTGNFIGNVANVGAVEAVSDHEVAFNLTAPSSIFLNTMTLYVPGIYDSTEMKTHATEADPFAIEWLVDHAAGFGPYTLSQVRPDEVALFVANPNYYGETPYFDRVIYREVPSAASRATLLLSGEVDWIDRPSQQLVNQFMGDDRAKVMDAPGQAMMAAWMNPNFKPFDDIRVRQALNYAVDRQLMIDSVLGGEGDIAKSIVPLFVDGYDDSAFPYNYNPEKARELLAEAGYADGLEIELLYSDLWWWLEPFTIQLSAQLAKVGVTVKPVRLTGSDMRSRSAPAVRDMPFFVYESGPIVLDPGYTLYLLAHTEGVSNRGDYKSEEFDKLVEQVIATPDRETRLAFVKEAQKVWVEDAPWVMVAYPKTFEAMKPDIEGWVFHPDNHERWADLTRAQ